MKRLTEMIFGNSFFSSEGEEEEEEEDDDDLDMHVLMIMNEDTHHWCLHAES
jgi:hypothetical protein